MPANRGAILLVLGFTVANLRKFFVTAQDTATEPHSVPLDHILVNFDLDGRGLLADNLLVGLQTGVHALLHKVVELLVEAVEEGAASREDDIFVQ